MNFGEKLKIIRTSRGLSQEELANRIGTTKQAISRYENSEREPNLRTAREFSKHLDVDLTVLADDNLFIPTREKIIQSRTSRGWSLSILADRTGISQSRLQSFESGDAFPSAYELTALSRAFSCSTDWMLGLEWGCGDFVSSLTLPEKNLILLFRRASDDSRREILSIVNGRRSDGSATLSQICEKAMQLDKTGLEKLLIYACDLVASGNYSAVPPSSDAQIG